MKHFTFLALLGVSAFFTVLADAGPALTESELQSDVAGKVVEVKLPSGKTMKLCYCPPGAFTMGSPKDEDERHDNEGPVAVRISKGFWIAQTECTQEQWKAIMGDNPSGVTYATLPVEQVSWKDAQKYVAKLNETVKLPAGWKFALPSEAQWEYACRAGTQTMFAFGNSLNSKSANVLTEYPFNVLELRKYVSLHHSSPVARYEPNAWGLYDMHGNVYEWCEDWYAEELAGGVDPTGAKQGSERVIRSGGWCFDADHCRSASRTCREPGDRINYVGFRPVLVPAP